MGSPHLTTKLFFQFATVVIGTAVAGMALPASAKGTSLREHCPAAAIWAKKDDAQSAAQKHALEAIRPSDPALAKQLVQRYARDQAVRHALISQGTNQMNTHSAAWGKMLAVDKDNLAWLKPQIESNGLPTVQQVGAKGLEAAWMLVQHAGTDPSFQVRVLKKLKPRLRTEPYLRSDYALLTDRIRLSQHKKQLYGTQLTLKHGQMVLQPVENSAGLAQRRARMDLMPLPDYMCEIRLMYHTPVKSAPQPAKS
ncbi:MAG: hypothetical protein PF483_04260 [Halothiobacillus sp.]|jgi:hypothetical protein|nr:hypothetical protein [Halothiobacillus sp.]